MSLLAARLAPLAVLLLALLSFAIGLADLPVQDRDEARFAQASRQMAETGDLIDIRLQDDARHNKPALIYWAQAAVLWVTGATGDTPIWLHRIPSYLAGALSALALIWAGTPIVGRRAAVLAGIMCATIYMVHAEARTAKTDAALLLSVILAMGALVRMYLDDVKRWSTPAIFWTALAAGFLLKGPMVVLPVIGAALWLSTKDRSASWLTRLRPLPGFLWFVALAAPWYVAISIATDGAFWATSLGGDFTDKITAEGEHSGSPPGLYLLTMWATFFPWSILIPLALLHAWRSRTSPATAILLGWLVPGWLVFELVPVKLVHYTLPLYPALMLLAGAALVRITDGTLRFARWPAAIGTGFWALALAFFATIAIAAPIAYGNGPDPRAIAGGLAMIAAALFGAVSLWRQQIPRAVAGLTLAGLTMGWTLTGASLPAARDFWISDRLAEAMSAHICLSGPVALAGFTEPSSVFRLGIDTILTDADGALSYLAAGENRAAWIAPDLLDETPPGGVPDVTEITGINIGNFRPVTLRLFVSPGVPAPDAPCPG